MEAFFFFFRPGHARGTRIRRRLNPASFKGTAQRLRRTLRQERDGTGSRVPDGKTRFLTPKCDQRVIRRQEDEVFSFGHAQQQAVERITVGLRGFHVSQDVFVGHG